MSTRSLLLGIDCGLTVTKAVVFAEDGMEIASASSSVARLACIATVGRPIGPVSVPIASAAPVNCRPKIGAGPRAEASTESFAMSPTTMPRAPRRRCEPSALALCTSVPASVKLSVAASFGLGPSSEANGSN